MNDSTLLDEISKNKRIIESDRWGKFLIKRPTNKINSLIDTFKTKSLNRDLQTKEVVVDPATGNKKEVPAFLTRKSKAKILQEHGEWTEEDEKAIEDAQQEYREVCIRLDEVGFQGAESLMQEYEDLVHYIKDNLEEEEYDRVKKEIGVLIPVMEQVESDEVVDDPNLFSDPEEGYLEAKRILEEAIQDIEVVSNLDRLDELHKQYNLFLEGIQAQAKLYTLKIRELGLFSDTVEARANKASQIAKIFYCTLNPATGNRYWNSFSDCEDNEADLLSWLLAEIEKFERLDPTESMEDVEKKYRFNFLFPLGGISQSSEDSHVQRSFNLDGESQETQ